MDKSIMVKKESSLGLVIKKYTDKIKEIVKQLYKVSYKDYLTCIFVDGSITQEEKNELLQMIDEKIGNDNKSKKG